MKVLEIRPSAPGEHGHILVEMFRLRARVFGGRLGWPVTITDGLEQDEFDQLNPTYLVVIEDDGIVSGAVRLLPANGPTMLEQAFPELIGGRLLQAQANTVESSRFCIDTDIVRKSASAAASLSTYALFAGIVEWGLINNYSQLVTATDLRMERILRRVGWPLMRLGKPVAIDATMAIAGSLSLHHDVFDRLVPVTYRSCMVGT
jgi:acyl homoserine lactone synthase